MSEEIADYKSLLRDARKLQISISQLKPTVRSSDGTPMFPNGWITLFRGPLSLLNGHP